MKKFSKKNKNHIIGLVVIIALIIGCVVFVHSPIFDFDVVVSTKIERVYEVFFDKEGDPIAFRLKYEGPVFEIDNYKTLRVDVDDFRTNGFELEYKDKVMYEHHIVKTQGKFFDEYYLVVGK